MPKLKRFVRLFRERMKQTEMMQYSVYIAFYLLLSFFPVLIVIGNILPLFDIDPNNLLLYLDTIIPAQVLDLFGPTLRNLLTSSSGGLLSLGIIGTLWAASKGVTAIHSGVNKAYGLDNTGIYYVITRVVSILTLALVLLMLVLILLLFSFIALFMDQIDPAIMRVLRPLSWVAVLVGLFIVLLMIYIFAPDLKVRIRDAAPGAAFVSASWMLLVETFALYVRYVARASGYGTIGAFFLLMIWLNLASKIILLGAILNATIYESKYGTPKKRVGKVERYVERILPSAPAEEKRSRNEEKYNRNEEKCNRNEEKP